jgi:DnaJ-class molecular chaperone
MFYSSGTPDKPKSYARYDVIADDGKGTCTVRNMGGVEYPVASYLIDEMAKPAEQAIVSVVASVCPTCDGRMFTFAGEDCPTCHGTGSKH